MSAVEKVFLDSNVLVYAHDRSEPVKGPQAQSLLMLLFGQGQPLVSVQVLSEFFWVVTRKIRAPLSDDDAAAEVMRFQMLARVLPVTWEILERALHVIKATGIPLWDSQIVAAASLHGASFVLSEDFQHRGVVEGVTCLNPFAADFAPAEVLSP